MGMDVLVLNAGSSSIKFSVFNEDDGVLARQLHGQVEGLPARPHFVARDAGGAALCERHWQPGVTLGHQEAIGMLADFLREQLRNRPSAVGHRVVHGGEAYSAPALVTTGVLTALEQLSPLAPLHQPHNLLPIRMLLDLAPGVPQVACFDTAFHRTIPAARQAYALPARITARGVRRYGFHGLSYEYIASALPRYDGRAAAGRCVVLHLGSGASACAMQACSSVGTSMGFTGLGGLPMGTRSGDLDPGVLLYILQELGMDAGAIETLLYRESGLLGVSGISGDVRSLLASGDERASRAIEVFVDAIGRELGAMAAVLGGLDALVFTAGIGEHAAHIRERVCRSAQWLGIDLDAAAAAQQESPGGRGRQ